MKNDRKSWISRYRFGYIILFVVQHMEKWKNITTVLQFEGKIIECKRWNGYFYLPSKICFSNESSKRTLMSFAMIKLENFSFLGRNNQVR